MHGSGRWTFAGGAGYYFGGFEAGERTRGKLVLLGPEGEYVYEGR
jgi:hypothetical protein